MLHFLQIFSAYMQRLPLSHLHLHPLNLCLSFVFWIMVIRISPCLKFGKSWRGSRFCNQKLPCSWNPDAYLAERCSSTMGASMDARLCTVAKRHSFPAMLDFIQMSQWRQISFLWVCVFLLKTVCVLLWFLEMSYRQKLLFYSRVRATVDVIKWKIWHLTTVHYMYLAGEKIAITLMSVHFIWSYSLL